MRKESLVHKIVRLSIFLALGIVLNIIESSIPLPIAIPGIRLGLANTMGLIVLYYYSPKEYVAIGFLRIFFVALFRTGLGSVSSFMSLAGWIVSTGVTLLVYLFKRTSIYGLSVISAMFHQVGQIVMVIILYNTPEFVNYLPVLLISGAISGVLVAFLTSKILSLLNRIFGVRIKDIETNNVCER